MHGVSSRAKKKKGEKNILKDLENSKRQPSNVEAAGTSESMERSLTLLKVKPKEQRTFYCEGCES